jgi:hypothetical protein
MPRPAPKKSAATNNKPPPLLPPMPPQADLAFQVGRIVEAKFEYQVSAEQAEEIALEQSRLILRLRGVRLTYFSFLLAIIFSLIGTSSLGTITLNGTDYTLTGRIIGAAIGFAFGFGIGLLIPISLKRKIRTTARTAYNRMGSMRTLSWNAEAIHFKSAVLESKVSWRMIDKIETADLGVYGVMGKRPLFAIPKAAFPPGASVDELIKAWQNGLRQPPVITSASKQ